MISFEIGLLIGMVMGLTGAGGALIAIPLFMQFMDKSLKEATVYSLVAVVVASLSNLFTQKRHVQYRTGLILIAFSTVGSYLVVPFKHSVSSFWIAIMLSVISLYALINIWLPTKIIDQNEMAINRTWSSVPIGLILGALTTFTGLGGGVLMVPVFIRFYKFKREEAIATSLFAVGLSSLGSLIIQIREGVVFNLDQNLLYLFMGILISVVLLKFALLRLKKNVLTVIQQVVFSLVVVLAMVKLLLM